MRQGQNRRPRGRNPNNSGGGGGNNNNNRRGTNQLTRSFESNGPDVKVRGTPQHIAEKYVQLARDAQSSGDPVMAENYLQHAEHYYRIVLAAQEEMTQKYGHQFAPQRPFNEDGEEDGEEGDEEGNNSGTQGGQQPELNQGQTYAPNQNQNAYGQQGDNPPRPDRNNGQPRRFDQQDRGPRQDNRGERQDRNDQRPRYDGPRQEGPRQEGSRQEGPRQDAPRQDGERSFRGDRPQRDQAPRDQDRNRDRFDRPRQDRGGQDRPFQDRPFNESAAQGQDTNQPTPQLTVEPRNPRGRIPVDDDSDVGGLPAFVTAPKRQIINLEPPIAPDVATDPTATEEFPKRRRGRPRKVDIAMAGSEEE